MTRKTFQAFADAVRGLRCERDRETMARFCADVFKRENPRFDAARFADACGLSLEALEPERMGCILEPDA